MSLIRLFVKTIILFQDYNGDQSMQYFARVVQVLPCVPAKSSRWVSSHHVTHASERFMGVKKPGAGLEGLAL